MARPFGVWYLRCGQESQRRSFARAAGAGGGGSGAAAQAAVMAAGGRVRAGEGGAWRTRGTGERVRGEDVFEFGAAVARNGGWILGFFLHGK